MTYTSADLVLGAKNLVINCASVTPGDPVLILHEDPRLGWYDLAAPQAVYDACLALGARPVMQQVAGPSNGADKGLAALFEPYRAIIFFARIGDQDRFADPPEGKICVMSYIRSAEMLASNFGRLHHHAMVQIKEIINEILLSAGTIQVRCPNGTDFSGYTSASFKALSKDVGVRRFPMGVHIPLDAKHFSGKIGLASYLTPTGSKVYEPASIALNGQAYAVMEDGKITGFDGPPATVRQIKDHYGHVAKLFDLEWNLVDSWHTGIHPGLAYDQTAARDPDRWSNTVFTSPRYLHIHTCGDYPPGEICLMVEHQTVTVDGTDLWASGRLCPQNFPQTRIVLEKWPALAKSYDHPAGG